MAEPRIEPHKITKPIQLLAVWLAALVILVGGFLAAARTVSHPPWLASVFGITAVALVPLFLCFIFVMQTKSATASGRPILRSVLEATRGTVKDFRPENTST